MFAKSILKLASHDLIIIGGGPGGYVAAIKAAQLGLNVACVEKRGSLGGTCLNVGCIPSKALLNATHHYHTAKHKFKDYGIVVGDVKMDVGKMQATKKKTVLKLTKGIEHLFRKNGVTYYVGEATLSTDKKVKVKSAEGEVSHDAKSYVIATGSEPIQLPFLPFDEQQVVSSTGALELKAPPKRLVVIGGGVIGLELGSVWGRLGSEVTVVEFLPHIAGTVDTDVGKELLRILTKQGFKFKLSTKVTQGAVATDSSGQKVVKLTIQGSDGKIEEIEADVVLVSVGRRPYTKNLGLESVGIKTDPRGFIVVDDHLATNVAGYYGIGDVINVGPMLAHKAEDEGVAIAESLAGKKGHINYLTIPNVVYTAPEVAWVGQTEQQVKETKVPYKVAKFPYQANSRASTNLETDGFVKVIADSKSGRLLGMHIIGSNAGEAIAEGVLAMEYSGSCEDVARTCHAHPTLSEAIKEACIAVASGKPIHI